jgi:hypothetical protein
LDRNGLMRFLKTNNGCLPARHSHVPARNALRVPTAVGAKAKTSA